MHIAERLKSERERLGYSQSEFAGIADATRKTVFNWESGSGSPSADVLAVWANVGLDVLYVITGDRSFVPPKKLSSEEETMLDYFKEASPAARKAAVRELLSATPGSNSTSSPKSAISIGTLHGQSIEGGMTNHGPLTFGVSPPGKTKKPGKS